MAKATYRLELRGSQINGEPFSCTGEQLGLLIQTLANLATNCVWFVADIEAEGSSVGHYQAGEPVLLGDSQKLINYANSIHQFIWGIFLAVPKDSLPKTWVRFYETEDLPFREMDGAVLEIRTFDTSYIEVYAQDSSLLDGLIQKFGGKLETESLTS
jgi:hypothetical protein